MSAADWSTVALATGPAAITGLLGYVGARLQSRATIRQAEVALDQLVEQHREDHLRHRQSTYHNLLDQSRRIDLMLTSPKESNDFQAWWDAWETHINGAYLYGTAAVRKAAEDLNEVFASLANVGDTDAIQRAYPQVRPQYIEKYHALVDAMRSDVAPRD